MALISFKTYWEFELNLMRVFFPPVESVKISIPLTFEVLKESMTQEELGSKSFKI